MTRYRLAIRPLTAVHIGCGESLTPLEYTFRKNKQEEDIFVRFRPETLVQGLNKEKKALFSSLAAGKDILALRKFLAENLSYDSILYTARVTSEFLKEFAVRSESEANSLEIEAEYRPAGQKSPVLPGSSIKGAFRTAILNQRIKKKRIKGGEFSLDPRSRYDTDLQRWGLDFRVPNDDPFRAISIGDCPFPPQDNQLIGRMLQYKPNRQGVGSFDSISIHAEVIAGELSGGSAQGVTDFLIVEELENFRALEYGALKFKAHRKILDTPISSQELLDSCDSFYGKAFDDEFNKFFLNAPDDSLYRSAQNLADLVDSLKSSNEHLVRIGRWSHVESVTLEDPFRRPFGQRGYGKTRTLLEYEGAYLPMGWCAFRLEKED